MRRRHTLLLLIGVLVVLLGAWWGAAQWYQQRLIIELRSQVTGEVTPRGTALSIAMNRRLTRLQGLYAYVQSEPFLSNFSTFVRELFAGSRGIRYIAAAPENTIRYIYPIENNTSLLGSTLLHDVPPDQLDDIQRSIQLRVITLSDPKAENGDETMVDAWLAVYREGSLWGMLSMKLDVSTLVKEVNIEGSPDDLVFALKDAGGHVFYGDEAVFDADPVRYLVSLPEGSWTLAAAPRGGWTSAVQEQVHEFQLAGLIIVGLVMGIVYLSVSRQAQLAEAVRQRTQEIARLNQELEARVERRTRELSTLLQTARSVASTLELQPLLVRILDQLREVVDYQAASIFLLEGQDTLNLLEYRGPLQLDELPRRHDLTEPDNLHLARVIQSKAPVILPGTDPALPEQKIMEADNPQKYFWMGVPLMAKGRVIGMLVLEHQKRQPYIEQQAELAFAFADQAAASIENARLYQQAQQLAALSERQKLARELHDSVSQALYGIVLGTRTATAKLNKKPEEVQEALDYVLSLSEGGLHEMRALIFELRPESLENEGLVAALTRQAEMLDMRHGIQVTSTFPEEPAISLEAKETLYRIARESIQNIIKHADAHKVALSLTADEEVVTLEIQDDGRGFDPSQPFPGHLGLQSMRERTEQLNGTLDVQSSEKQGTLIRATIPKTGDEG
ncbi:MAG: GAF domain-containing protein [Anaerolineae bacterium]|nr:GAF domain-containing protein [Anaerolineae bacterium]